MTLDWPTSGEILSDVLHDMRGMGQTSINNILYRLHQAGYLESFPNNESILSKSWSENTKKLTKIKDEIKTKYELGA